MTMAPAELIEPLLEALDRENKLNWGFNILYRVYVYLTDPAEYERRHTRWGKTIPEFDDYRWDRIEK